MALGTVKPYNNWLGILGKTAFRQWDDSAAGNIMFVLANSSYTPSYTHTTLANVGTADVDYIATGSGGPIAATTLAVDTASTAGSTHFNSDAANFGSSVTASPKYLLAVQPVTANVIESTAKLLWYVDLNTAGGSLTVASAPLSIPPPSLGWLSVVRT